MDGGGGEGRTKQATCAFPRFRRRGKRRSLGWFLLGVEVDLETMIVAEIGLCYS